MSLTTILSEIWRFLKDHLFKIFIGALIVSVLAILGSLFLPSLLGPSPEEVSDEEQLSQLPPDEDAQASRDYLSEVYLQEPAEFELFIQLEDGNVFGNSFIFDEYFTSPNIVAEIEQITGVEYSQTLAHELNLGFYKTSQYRGSVAGIRDTSSNVVTIRVQVAESSADNLKLAEAFADRIMSREIPFTEPLSITMLSEPEIGEKLQENHLQMVSSPEALGIFAPAESNSRSILLYGVAGFILGALLSATVLFIIQLFKGKINYAFQYSWDFDDHHYVYGKDKDREQLKNFLLVPEMNQQILVTQESPFAEKIISDTQQLEHTTALSRIARNKEEIDEIVLLVESNVTDKEWFNEQYRLAEMYESQITIVQAMNG